MRPSFLTKILKVSSFSGVVFFAIIYFTAPCRFDQTGAFGGGHHNVALVRKASPTMFIVVSCPQLPKAQFNAHKTMRVFLIV